MIYNNKQTARAEQTKNRYTSKHTHMHDIQMGTFAHEWIKNGKEIGVFTRNNMMNLRERRDMRNEVN